MNKIKAFLKRKDIEFSAKRYFQDALSAMALGLFSSLLIGLIIKTAGRNMDSAERIFRILHRNGKSGDGTYGSCYRSICCLGA